MYHSFLVRISQGTDRVPTDIEIKVESIQNGETYQFRDLDLLLKFFQAVVEQDIAKNSQAVLSESDKKSININQ